MAVLVPFTCKAVEALMVGAVSVPVKVGLFEGAFESKAVCVAVDMGLDRSEVSSTLPKPTIALVIPDTVPSNTGLFIGALALTEAFDAYKLEASESSR